MRATKLVKDEMFTCNISRSDTWTEYMIRTVGSSHLVQETHCFGSGKMLFEVNYKLLRPCEQYL